MSIHDIKPAHVKVEEIKEERPYPGPNGTAIYPNDMGIIKTAPDDLKPPQLDGLFGSNSPPRAKSELPATPLRSPSSSPGPSRPPLHGRQSSRKKAAAVEHKPMMVDDLPMAWDEAHATFTALDKCVYETKGLGLSREQDDMMVCDCVYDKRNPDTTQCGPQSDCVNRAIFIECLSAECRAKGQCRNQRFSKQQYANLDVVQTEKKGFGLRAGQDLSAGSLVYEYIGEVVAEKTFRKRMQQYADEGIRHFYFMMLQKEEYIDATKKGGIGRFANHSCNPNSEVQKWVVGRRLRMGIFTKHDVVKGEEITFNYNVDRYGHDAQICYCGEPNCVGTIGGKTQTDIGGMGDLLIQALGIADDVESMDMKGSKKRKARQLDDIDYIPILKPIPDPETAQKVAAAMRQTMENSRVLSYLLQRIKITEDAVVQRQLIRMHGFSLMTMVLTDLADDVLLVSTALEAMYQWKLQEKNKVEDCGIQEPVQRLADSSDPRISGPARKLLQYWSTLVTSYRIARKPKIASLDAEDEATTTTIAEAESAQPSSAMDHRRPAHSEYDNVFAPKFTVAPVRRGPPMPAFARPRPPPPPPQSIRTPSNSAVAERSRLDAIIALAQQNASTPTATPGQRGITNSPSASSPQGSRSSMPSPAPRPVEEIWEEEERRKKQEKERERERRKKQKLQSSSTSSSSERDDKRAKKLIGDIVVPTMSKYKQKVDRDQFKRFAQQCTELLLEKEKKGKHYSQFCRMTTVPDEKRKKIQAFSEDYTIRLIAKIEAKGKSRESRKDSTDAVKVNGNGNSSHDASTTPGDSCVVATPEMPGSSSQTPGHVDPDDNYGESDLEMDLDMDAELEDHTFSVVRDKSAQ